jgi:uncharacterized protein (TIGR02118 family)
VIAREVGRIKALKQRVTQHLLVEPYRVEADEDRGGSNTPFASALAEEYSFAQIAGGEYRLKGGLMARLVALYKTPKDLSAFDRYYVSTHIPLAKTLPGLRKYEISDGGVHSPGGVPGYHLVATLHFASVADIHAALASPEGQATAADLGNFADGGVELLLFETREV